MRVLLLTPMPPAADGGGAIPVLLRAELLGLLELHEVTLVTALGDEPWEAPAVEALREEGVDLHVADRRQPRQAAARWRRRLRLGGTWARRGWPWRTVWFAEPGIQPLLDRVSATTALDVVAVEDSAMSVFRLPPRVPSVFTHHEVLRPRGVDWRAGRPRNWPLWGLGEIDRRRWEEFQRSAWRRFDRVQVFSRRDADALALIAPDAEHKVRINPFGLVLPRRMDPAREAEGSVLFVGNFAHPPNRQAAIWLAREIMPMLLARFPRARLRVVGTAPPAAIRRLAGPQVEVIADAPSVIPHLEAAAVVVAPVRSGGGMRMKVLEALAAGKAVVTTRLGTDGLDGLGEEPPLLVADDAEGVAAATASLLGDGDTRRSLGERARSFAERHHSPAAWAQRLTAVYEEAREARARWTRG